MVPFSGYELIEKVHQAFLILTAKTQRTQSKLFFSFAAETPANENYNAFGNLKLLKYYPPGLEFILFRPLSEKE